MRSQITVKDPLVKNWLHDVQRDWNRYAKDILKARLDPDQQEILNAIQYNRRVSVRSGTARGKDFVGAIAAICFYALTPRFRGDELISATKVAMVAPTGRQIRNIMVPEVTRVFQKARSLPGYCVVDGVRNARYKDWFICGFKAADDNVEAWSGLHAPNVMVLVTEASGLSQITFDAIEGILQGNSRLVLMFNPNNTSGEAYRSQRSPQYVKFRLNDLNAPNVINYARLLDDEITKEEYRQLKIPGQVDYLWIQEKIDKPGWVTKINKEDAIKEDYDFEWRGEWYKPNDLFRVKVLGEFPIEAEDTLIPLSWIEAANNRWDLIMEEGFKASEPLRLGVDVAGMGRDNTIFCHRYGEFVHKFTYLPTTAKKATVHMHIAGKVLEYLRDPKVYAFLDTIGEGAGTYSRLIEQGYKNAISAKASFGAKGLRDETGVRKFANMRAFMFWSLRDALNPVFGHNLALPRNDMLTEELTEHTYEVNSQGLIQIEEKKDIIERLGRSPDAADSLALTYFPEHWVHVSEGAKDPSKESLGLF